MHALCKAEFFGIVGRDHMAHLFEGLHPIVSPPTEGLSIIFLALLGQFVAGPCLQCEGGIDHQSFSLEGN